VCVGLRWTNYVEQAHVMHRWRWPYKFKVQIHADGHDVQTPATHWHADVSRAYNAPVYGIPSILQLRAHLVELLAIVDMKGVCHIFKDNKFGPIEVYVF
jgi:hypothetical protein